MIGPTIAVIATVFLFALFIVSGLHRFRGLNNYESYFLASRSVGSKENSASYVARFTSLATVIGFFLVFARFDGLYLLISPFSVLLGIMIFSFVMRRYGRISENTQRSHRSITEKVSVFYGSNILGYLVTVISIFTILSILLIEIFVGVQIVSLYIKDNNPYIPVTVIIVCFPLFTYVAFGGLESVVSTDRIQAFLIILFVAILFLFIFYRGDIKWGDFFPRSIVADGIFILPYFLLANIVFVNIFLFPSLYSTWQMRYASSSDSDFIRGTLSGSWRVLVSWSALVFCGVSLAAVVAVEVSSIADLTNALATSSDWFVSYIIFPLFFIAAVSALFSTADSAIVPIVQSVYDFVFRGRNFSIWKPILISYALFFVVILCYIFVFTILQFNFINFLFSVFAFSLSISTVILWMFIFPTDVNRDRRGVTLSIGVAVSFMFACAISYIGNEIGQMEIVQMSAPSAVVVTLVFQIISLKVDGGIE